MKKLLLCLALTGFGMTVNSYAQTYYLSQDFESCTSGSLPSGWSQTTTGGGEGWISATGPVSLLHLGSAFIPAHTTFALLEDANSPHNHPAMMTTAAFTATSGSNVYLTFDSWFRGYYYPSTNPQEEKAWVDISTDGGATWSVHDTIQPASGWSTNAFAVTVTAGASCKLRFCYTDNASTSTDTFALAGVAIDNVHFGVPAASDIEITAISPLANSPVNDYGVVSTPVTFGGTAFNNSYNTITSFVATYQVASGSPVNTTITASIAPFTSYNFTCTPYTLPATAMQQNVTMWLTESGDANLNNDTMSTVINSVLSFPKKRIFYEEPTGSWCGYCVRGIVYMDSMWDSHPNDVSIVAVHDHGNYDPMAIENAQTTAYDQYVSTFPGFQGYPGLIVDRSYIADPSDAFTYYNAIGNEFGFAGITMTQTITGGNVNVSATVTPAMNLSGDYRLELIVEEDDVHNTGTGWSQHNYYATDVNNQPLSGAGFNFQDSSSGGVVSTDPPMYLHFKFVDRYTLPTMSSSTGNGIASSLPASMTAGTPYSYTFAAVPIASDWVSTHLRTVVLLIDNNPSSATYGAVLNSVNSGVPLGTTNVEAGIEGVRVFPVPAKDAANLVFGLSETDKVSVTVIDATGRVAYSLPAEQYTMGDHLVKLPLNNFSNGIYSVVVRSSKGSVTEKLSVIK